eukprot:scaffold1062_cov130-Cylindrotheca_fusiformis.AAC.3
MSRRRAAREPLHSVASLVVHSLRKYLWSNTRGCQVLAPPLVACDPACGKVQQMRLLHQTKKNLLVVLFLSVGSFFCIPRPADEACDLNQRDVRDATHRIVHGVDVVVRSLIVVAINVR